MTTLRGCSTADDLIAALSSPSSRAGLHSRFAAYLQPFCPTCPPRTLPNTPPKRVTKQAKQPQQQPPPPARPSSAPLRSASAHSSSACSSSSCRSSAQTLAARATRRALACGVVEHRRFTPSWTPAPAPLGGGTSIWS
ncbi:hypothetical protein ZWY2020_013206 [Hordeum vulgare]|nr:hypothetical protein ZWY2020_013206 [Hordeum vulgare]